jgi:hypothetical protein
MKLTIFAATGRIGRSRTSCFECLDQPETIKEVIGIAS